MQKQGNTRVSWLLRKSRDLYLTAEKAQHLKQTLIRVYEKQPKMRVAMYAAQPRVCLGALTIA